MKPEMDEEIGVKREESISYWAWFALGLFIAQIICGLFGIGR